MRIVRMLLAGAVPVGIGLVAFLNASAVSSLVSGTIAGGTSPATYEGVAAASTGAPRTPAKSAPSADAILERNPFDHVTGSLKERASPELHDSLVTDPRSAPTCDGVRPLVVVGDEDQSVAFAAFDVGGTRVLRRRGGDVGGRRVAYVGRDRVWLEGPSGLCQSLLFGAPVAAPLAGRTKEVSGAEPGTRSQLELDVAKQIVKTGPNEYAIERSAVDRILEAQQELMKARVFPEREGDRVVGMKVLGIKPGSVLAMLGIENGDRLETINGFEVSNPEKVLEAYARLRAGSADRLTVHVTRAGKPINVDYTIR